MIVVRVELHSARDGSVTELARMHIANRGDGTAVRRNYDVRTLKGRSTAQLNKNIVQRMGVLMKWPSLRKHVWALVFTSLIACGYAEDCLDTGAVYGRGKE